MACCTVRLPPWSLDISTTRPMMLCTPSLGISREWAAQCRQTQAGGLLTRIQLSGASAGSAAFWAGRKDTVCDCS